MLKSLRVSNYRAFHELRIDKLSRINLISGRNNSGKTTLLEALLLLSAGHPEITMHTSVIRGMQSERPAVTQSRRSTGGRCSRHSISGPQLKSTPSTNQVDTWE